MEAYPGLMRKRVHLKPRKLREFYEVIEEEIAK